MAKISTYPEIVSPVVTDLLIGTDVSNSNATKNFTVQSIVDLGAFNAQDLQSVLDAGNSATENLTLIGTGTFTNISVTSNATITANLTAQGDVALGVLTTSLVPKLDNTYNLGSTTLHWGSLFIDGQVSGDSVIIDTGLVGATNFNIASTLSIKTYVDNQVGGVDTLSELLAKNPSPLTNPSNTTGGTDIVVSANDDITLTDSSKIKLSGTSLQIYSTGSGNSFIKGPTSGNLNITSDILILSKSNGDYMLSHGGEGVSIYYRGSTTPGVKLLTTSAGISVTGVGTFNTDEFNSIIVNSATTPSILLHNVNNSYYWRTIASGNGLLNFDLSTSSPTANFASKLSLGANIVIVGTPSVVLGNNISSLTEVRGDLQVDGSIIHGGGGGGTAKGGTFSKLFTAGTAGTSVQAFTITRDSGAMTFDVWFTCDMANDTSISKKYTVAKQFGDATKIFYNKIIDTGAGTGSTSGVAHDFDVSFDIKSAGSNTGMEANITPKGVASMVIGITIDLGIGANNATVVMN